MNRFAAVTGLALVVAGALWLSASSTLLLGVRQGVPDAARPALVLVLEIASVVGTALWVTAANRRDKTRPAIVVGLSSLVAGIGGCLAYGPLGLVAPVSVVLVTDMIAERWPTSTRGDTEDTATPAVAPEPNPEPAAIETARVYDIADLFPPAPAAENAAPHRDATTGTPCGTPHGPLRTLVTLEQLDDLSRDELRALARAHDLTVRGSADELRERLRPLLAAAAPVPHTRTQVPA